MQFVFGIMIEAMFIETTYRGVTGILFPKYYATINQVKLSFFTYFQKDMNIWSEMETIKIRSQFYFQNAKYND